MITLGFRMNAFCSLYLFKIRCNRGSCAKRRVLMASACHLKSEGNCYRESSRGTVPVRAMPRIAKCVKPARFLSLRFLPLYLINSHSHPFSLFARYLLYLTHLPHLAPLQLQRSVRHETGLGHAESLRFSTSCLPYSFPSHLYIG